MSASSIIPADYLHLCFTGLKYRKKEKTGKMILQIDDDFDLRKIMDSGQCFRWEQLDRHTYRIPYLDQRLYVTDLGGGAFELSCGDEQLALWRDYFDLAEDYRAIRAIPDPVKDPFLTRAAEAEKGIRILRQDPWEVTVSFIISQNRNIPAIRRSVELLCAAAGQKRIDGRGEAFHAFPTPEEILALSDADLSECRLGYRCRYVRAAARAVSGGELDFAALKLMDRRQGSQLHSALRSPSDGFLPGGRMDPPHSAKRVPRRLSDGGLPSLERRFPTVYVCVLPAKKRGIRNPQNSLAQPRTAVKQRQN